MLVESGKGLRAASSTPQEKFVVVATRCELLIIERPLQPTDFLSVPDQPGGVVLWTAQVTVHDAVVAAAGAEE